MRMYSAVEAIQPAWDHARALLWHRRDWRQLLKLTLLAVGAELGNSFNVRGSRFLADRTAHDAKLATLSWSIFLLLGVLGLLITAALLYLGSRLQLAQFDVLVLRDPQVAPAWRRHGPQTWRWAGIRVLVGIVTLLAFSPLLLPVIPLLIAAANNTRPGGAGAGVQMGAMLGTFAGVFFVVFAAVLVIRLVTSLLLPAFAMEDLPLGATLQRGWQIFRSDVGGMLLFGILQPLLLFLLGVVVLFGMVIVLLLLALPFLLVGAVVWGLLHMLVPSSSAVLPALGITAAVLVGLVWILLYLVVSGSLMTFARTWSLYFLGGRYPMLGQYLEPEVAIPVWTPPPSLPRDEDDDSSGPDLPADPVLA